MTALKGLKTLALAAFAVLLVLSLLLLLFNITLEGTVFSQTFFNSTFDKSIKPDIIEQYVSGITDDVEAFMPLSLQDKKDLKAGKASAELKKRVNEYKALMKEAVNTEWIKSEAPKLVKGGFAYFSGNGDKLPAINVKPLKGALVSVFSDQITSSGSMGIKQFNEMVTQIELASGGILIKGKVNEKAVDLFMQIGQATSMNMKRDTAKKILLKIGNRKADGKDNQELYEYTINAMVADALGTDKMKNELDLNQLVNEAYPSGSNPVTGFHTMLKDIRCDLLLLTIIIVVLLLAIIAVTAFVPQSILRWMGVPLIVSGVLYLILPLFSGLLNNLIIKQFSAQADLLFIQNWLQNYVGGITLFMVLSSAAAILIGVGFLVAANHFDKGRGIGRNRHSAAGRGGTGVMVCRVAAVVVLLAAIPFSVVFFGRAVSKHAQEFDRVLKASATQKGAPSLDRALGKVLGVDLFGGLGK